MSSSTLFIISTLALLGAASADYCITDAMGDLSPYNRAIPFQETAVPAGPNTVTFPNPCGADELLVGLQVEACSGYPPASVVQVLDLQRAFISGNQSARVDAVAYCRLGRAAERYHADPYLHGHMGNILIGLGQ